MIRGFLVLTGETAYALKLHQEPFGELIAVYGWLFYGRLLVMCSIDVHRLKLKTDCTTSDCWLEDTMKRD